MAELTCPAGHRLGPDGRPGPFCSAECEVVPEEDTPADVSSAPPEVPTASGPVSADGDHVGRAAGAAGERPTAGLVAVVGDHRIALPPGCRVLLGRDPESPAAEVLRSYDNVSRRHLELAAIDGGVLVRPLPSRNGTYVEGHPLAAEQERVLTVPVTVRMAANCFVRIEDCGE